MINQSIGSLLSLDIILLSWMDLRSLINIIDHLRGVTLTLTGCLFHGRNCAVDLCGAKRKDSASREVGKLYLSSRTLLLSSVNNL